MRKNVIIYFFTAILLAFSVFISVIFCESDEFLPFYVVVSSDEKSEKIDCWKNDEDEYYVFLPSFSELSNVQIYLNTDNRVYINKVEIIDGMSCAIFEENAPYELSYKSFGKKYTHKITFVKTGEIPTMYITTDSGDMEYIHSKKGNKESGEVSIYLPDGSLNCKCDFSSLGGRGNSTWEMFDKKPYNLEFQNETDLLDMGKAYKWVLIANSADSSNIRNKAIYDFASDFGLEYSPETEWVDLYLNGEYVGLYLLSERNEVHKQRVNIAGDTSFLLSLEKENRLVQQNKTYFSTSSGQDLRVHYPTNPSENDINAISNIVCLAENAIFSPNGIDVMTGKYWYELIDTDSWARKYLIEEIFGNVDAGYLSQFFYYDANDVEPKIYAGPVWDYDSSMGNDCVWQIGNPYSFTANRLQVTDVDDASWFYSLYQKEAFYQRVRELYQTEVLPLLNALISSGFYDYSSFISQSAYVNELRWGNEVEDNSKDTNEIINYMSNRRNFLNSLWINEDKYCTVKAGHDFGGFYAYYAVRPGECLTELPDFDDTDIISFKGWYYSDTDEPFDISKPIYEDTAIYAKWQEKSGEKFKDILKLVPLAVIAVMFVIFVVADIKKNGWRKNE